ncbi:hypothetical protein Y032_0003g1428 [Ancylostoma ceylanicum]|uniref:DUF5641 domain-containing protein n=1 Tax=Ancylostoma ceylanicum TaxID=53326 RepID=A0A016VXL6_9BILA|nr:hypothetical protein Y032_0003g1428 [Ancylostoma ceylanicum]
MSVPGHYKGQITRAINSLRRKNADVDPALFEQFDPAGTPDTHEFLMSSYQELRSSLEQFWSIWYKDYLQALAEKIQIYASPKRGSRDWPKEQQRWLQPRCQREALRFSRSMDVPAIDGWTRPAVGWNDASNISDVLTNHSPSSKDIGVQHFFNFIFFLI